MLCLRPTEMTRRALFALPLLALICDAWQTGSGIFIEGDKVAARVAYYAAEDRFGKIHQVEVWNGKRPSGF